MDISLKERIKRKRKELRTLVRINNFTEIGQLIATLDQSDTKTALIKSYSVMADDYILELKDFFDNFEDADISEMALTNILNQLHD